MKHVFDDADREKKKTRVTAKDATKTPAGLTEAIKTSLADGYLPCTTAFEIAKKFKTAPSVVGNAADDMGIRVTDCRLGCFKVDKTVQKSTKNIKPEITGAVESENARSPLTCASAFGLAKRLKVSTMEIADAANAAHIKFRNCQLGCF
jgi:hypothetical protein